MHEKGMTAVTITDHNSIDGETGFIVRGGSEEALMKAMALVASDPIFAARMGVAARRYADGLSFERAFEQTWHMYEDTSVQALKIDLNMLASVA